MGKTEDKATTCANFVSENCDLILTRWETLAQSRLLASQKADQLVLRNHIPALIDDLSRCLQKASSGCDPQEAVEWGFVPSTSEEHGRHRAATSYYSVEQLVEEYALLRQTITNFVIENDLADFECIETITRTIEMASVKAVGAFGQSIQKTQRNLIGALAHDIRNPISVARQSLDLLAEPQEGQTDDSNMLITMAQRSLDRSVSMLEEMLDVVRVESGAGINLIFEEHDLTEIVKSICHEAQLVYPKEICSEYPTTPVPGIFDQAGIRRVIENLVSNAVKYGKRGTPVNLKMRESHDTVSISVHNEGNPITEAEKSRIFQFLSRSEGREANSGRSWGVGLSLVRVIARAHEGDVTVESSAEEGTTFTVTIKKFSRELGESSAVLF